MWKSLIELRIFKSAFGPVPIQIQGLRHKNGFKITHEMQDDPEFGNIQVFRCKGKFKEFTFAATRFQSGKPTALYEVLLSVDLTPNPEMCCAYREEIESALFNFPDINRFGPVEKVLFNIKGNLFRANELPLSKAP